MTTDELPQGVEPGTISLVLGHPDPALLPADELRAAASKSLSGQAGRQALQYGAEQGALALIEFLVDKLNRDEGLGVTSENLLVTAGSTGAVDTCARLFAGSGGAVLVEAPSYRDSLHVFADHGVDLRPVPIDEEGLIPELLARQLDALGREGKPPRLLYTIPNFQNPSGVTLSEPRRRAVLALAQQHGFLVVEDDVYRDLAFEGGAPPSLYALSGGDRVLRIGSFSKIIAPGLRLGWLIGAPEHIRRIVDCGVSQMGGGANPLMAHVVGRFCADGHLEPHIQRLRQAYRARRDVMLAALERYMPPGLTWTRPSGGFFVWLTLPKSVTTAALQGLAAGRKVFFSAGEGFFARGGGECNLRLAFSFAPPEQMEEAVAVLAECIRAIQGAA